jgi:hypothetical protein
MRKTQGGGQRRAALLFVGPHAGVMLRWAMLMPDERRARPDISYAV